MVPKRRTPREVLNELKWREDLRLAAAEIWCLDRNRAEGYSVIPGEDIRRLGPSFFDTTGATIPYHRIFRITHRGREVYRRPGVQPPEGRSS